MPHSALGFSLKQPDGKKSAVNSLHLDLKDPTSPPRGLLGFRKLSLDAEWRHGAVSRQWLPRLDGGYDVVVG